MVWEEDQRLRADMLRNGGGGDKEEQIHGGRRREGSHSVSSERERERWCDGSSVLNKNEGAFFYS